LAPGSAIARKLAPAFDPTASSSTEPEVTEPMVMTPEPVAIQFEPEPQSDPAPAPVIAAPAVDMPFRLQDSSATPAAPAPPVAPVLAQVAPPAPAAPVPAPPVAQAAPVESPPAPVPAAQPIAQVDAETQYALGMAYKDMGLLEEAKEEFVSSMKDSGFFVDSCLMLGLCLKEQNRFDQAIQLLEKLIADSRCRGGNAQLVRYELAMLYEKTGARDRALAMYQSIPSFHDVPRRVEALRTLGTNGVAHPERPASSQTSPLPLAGH
jgi:tetratricopeptide (TPR) repeat protein